MLEWLKGFEKKVDRISLDYAEMAATSLMKINELLRILSAAVGADAPLPWVPGEDAELDSEEDEPELELLSEIACNSNVPSSFCTVLRPRDFALPFALALAFPVTFDIPFAFAFALAFASAVLVSLVAAFAFPLAAALDCAFVALVFVVFLLSACSSLLFVDRTPYIRGKWNGRG